MYRISSILNPDSQPNLQSNPTEDEISTMKVTRIVLALSSYANVKRYNFKLYNQNDDSFNIMQTSVDSPYVCDILSLLLLKGDGARNSLTFLYIFTQMDYVIPAKLESFISVAEFKKPVDLYQFDYAIR